jgi:hypothetical protein
MPGEREVHVVLVGRCDWSGRVRLLLLSRSMRLGLIVAVALSLMPIGCELVIGDETRAVADGGDLMLGDAVAPDDSASQPDVSSLEADASGSQDVAGPQPDCGAPQNCIDMATMCNDACAHQNNDCLNKGPGHPDCPAQFAACEMTCLSQCIACVACPTADAACTNSTH